MNCEEATKLMDGRADVLMRRFYLQIIRLSPCAARLIAVRRK